MTQYVAAKTAVVGLTKSLSLELGPEGITVNTIPPGFIDTPMLRKVRRGEVFARGRGRVLTRALDPGPEGWGRPEDIAAVCAFLVRDEADYITGQVIGVNGGRNT